MHRLMKIGYAREGNDVFPVFWDHDANTYHAPARLYARALMPRALVKIGYDKEGNDVFPVFWDHDAFLDGEPWHYWTHDPDEPAGTLCPWVGKTYVDLNGFIVSAD